ncbi:DnaD domain protein [Fredinandcohnia sp. 179-A 10B2 NHS]|uniref:DnaD domain protein n=1 Tax=Fredinandcohnia sp. 179-A 10B2 NHS TaxID=3235176 RepID=UPI0039A3AB8B
MWLINSNFVHPKEIILKAMQITSVNSKRKLNYVIRILKNWENESLLTVEDIDFYNANEYGGSKQKEKVEAVHRGRAIPTEFVFDITAGEK